MTTLVDISVVLRPEMPTWPGSVGLRLTQTMRIADGDQANVSRLDTDVHMGTHIDAPWHFLADGRTIDAIPLEDFVGPAWVAHFPDVASVTAADLEAAGIPAGTTRLLLKTRNSARWHSDTAFREDFVALTLDGAQWVVDRGMRLVGNDYLSVQRYQDGPQTHYVLLGAKVILLEGINLAGVEPGAWELICLPMRLAGIDGAPARAVLRREAGR